LARYWDWRKINWREVGACGGNTTQKYISAKMGRISQHTVLKYTAYTHRMRRANMEGIL